MSYTRTVPICHKKHMIIILADVATRQRFYSILNRRIRHIKAEGRLSKKHTKTTTQSTFTFVRMN